MIIWLLAGSPLGSLYSGSCKHVLLDYDATFVEFKSGYLAEDDSEIENCKKELLKLIKQGIKPEIIDEWPRLQLIWEHALNTYEEVSDEIDLHIPEYLIHLYVTSDYYDCIAIKYPDLEDDENEFPGFSSIYIIYYSENPKATLKKYNDDIFVGARLWTE